MDKEKQKEWYQANKERIKAKRKEYYKDNIDKIKEYRKKNKDKIRQSNYEYYLKNNELINEKRNKKWKDKYENDPMFKFKHNIRTGTQRIFKQSILKKTTKTEILLGCSFIELKNHLESKLQPWMNWDNYGKYNGEFNHGWDIDHIIPISSAKTVEDVIKLSHYTNLQPLCSYINRYVKRAQID
jgi:hypothetical protein